MNALILLMPEDFRDEEFQVPKDRLEAAGVSVTVVGLRGGKARGALGLTVSPNIIISDVNVDGYDALIVPGGPGSPRYLWNDVKVLSLVKEAYDKGKIVAAICLAGVVLANAGILRWKNATVFKTPQSMKIFKEKGVNYVEQGVVVDGRIVTAQGPSFAEEFADEIIRLLKAE